MNFHITFCIESKKKVASQEFICNIFRLTDIGVVSTKEDRLI